MAAELGLMSIRLDFEDLSEQTVRIPHAKGSRKDPSRAADGEPVLEAV